MTDAPGLREIRLDGVTVELGGRRALDDVTVALDRRRIAVIGANGSGKSTFARVVAGLTEPSAGSVRVNGVDAVRETRRLRGVVGVVFTDPDAQILMPTVAEDVRFSLRRSGLSRDEIDARVASMLGSYGLADLADAPAHSLSGGQKQLLALAAVLIRRPSLVIADEPTTLLDLRNARIVGDLLIDELDAQTLLVTHDLGLAARCDVAIRFREGRLVEQGDPADVVAHYREEEA